MIQNPILPGFNLIRVFAEKGMTIILQFLLLNGFREFRFIIPEI